MARLAYATGLGAAIGGMVPALAPSPARARKQCTVRSTLKKRKKHIFFKETKKTNLKTTGITAATAPLSIPAYVYWEDRAAEEANAREGGGRN